MLLETGRSGIAGRSSSTLAPCRIIKAARSALIRGLSEPRFIEIGLVFSVLCCCVGGYLIGGEQLYVVGLNLSLGKAARIEKELIASMMARLHRRFNETFGRELTPTTCDGRLPNSVVKDWSRTRPSASTRA